MGPFIVDTGMNTTKKITEPTGVEPLTLGLKKFSYEVLGSLDHIKETVHRVGPSPKFFPFQFDSVCGTFKI